MHNKKHIFLSVCAFLFVFSAHADEHPHRYRGGAYDGWDFQQVSPVMYGGGSGHGHDMDTSDVFTPGIPPEPDELNFVVQPPPVIAIHAPFSCAVEVIDENGNIYDLESLTVTLEIETDPPGGSTLGGDVAVQTVDGVASFDGLTIDKIGDGFRLQATTPKVALPGLSEFFNVIEPFTIIEPEEGAEWFAGRTYDIRWTTPPGGAAAADLFYATGPGFTDWQPIAASVSGDTHAWTIPNFLSQNVTSKNVKIKVADSANLDLYVVSDTFTVSLYEITFRFFNYHAGNEIHNIEVSCSSGWVEAKLQSGVKRHYAYDTYTTLFSKEHYFVYTLSDWVADAHKTNMIEMVQVSGDYAVEAVITREVNNYWINSWLHHTGTIDTDARNCRISIVDAAEAEVTSAFQALPNPEGFFRIQIDISNITTNHTYLAKIGIENVAGIGFSNAIMFGLFMEGTGGEIMDLQRLYDEHADILDDTAEILARTGEINTNIMWLGTSYDALRASYESLDPKIDTLGAKMDASLTGIEDIRRAVGADELDTLYAMASETRDLVDELPSVIAREAKKGVQSKILNRPVTTTNGATVMIRYKTEVGTTPVINVYDPNNIRLIADAFMTDEIGGSGIYEYALTILDAWPLGEYTIICSEATTASADSMVLQVAPPADIPISDIAEIIDKLDIIIGDLSVQSDSLDILSEDMSLHGEALTEISGGIEAIRSDITSINTLIDAISENVNTLVANWDEFSPADIHVLLDQLAKYMGTPFDGTGHETLFGKIARVYESVGDVPVGAIFSDVQMLRAEIALAGRTETAYSMLAEIRAGVESLQTAFPVETIDVAEDVWEVADAILVTRETLEAIAREAGVGIVLGTLPDDQLTLQHLYDRIAELKIISQTILELLLQREKPVVRSWLESGSVRKRILVANHSKTVDEIVEVKEYLPEGIWPEDIIYIGDFNLGYDFEHSLYFVHQRIKLPPDASRTLEVVMKDVWRIDETEIAMLREHMERLDEILTDSRYAEQVALLCENIGNRMDRIIEVQNKVTTTESRLSNYEMNKGSLADIKKDIGILEDLVVEIRGLPADMILGEISPISSWDELDVVEGLQPPRREITMKIEMANPLSITNTAPLEYSLPAEVKPDLIADKGDLEVRYNPRQRVHYLYSSNLVFEPHQTKTFSVVLNDVWYIPDPQLVRLGEHTEKLIGMFAESEAREAAEFLGARIRQSLAAIMQSQQQKDLPADVHIGNYRVNVNRLEEVKDDIARLERLIVQTGGKPGWIPSVRDIKVKEGGVIPAAGRDAREIITANTWRIIWTVIAFTGVVSFLFYMHWQMVSRKKEAEKYEKLETEGK